MRFVLFAVAALACGLSTARAQDAPRVMFETTRGGFVVELAPDKAPKTVANFLQYVEDGHYYRTIVHRVVPDRVIQGGGYSRYFNERPTRKPVPYEGANGLSNERGTIAMARGPDPDSAAAQWYVNLADNSDLDHVDNDLGVRPGYVVFGRVIEGMETVDAIGAVETGAGGPFESEVPAEPIVIEDATIVKGGE